MAEGATRTGTSDRLLGFRPRYPNPPFHGKYETGNVEMLPVAHYIPSKGETGPTRPSPASTIPDSKEGGRMQEVDPRRGVPRAESYLDPASETYASRFFDACFERELTRCVRYGDSVTLGLLSVRGADASGGPSPDLGRLILSSIREVDLAAFRGGDCYTLMLVKASADVAAIVGERVLNALADRCGTDGAAWLGLASYPRDGSSSAALQECAARALGKARETGPNRIYHFPREGGAAASDQPRILVVDDDPRNVKLLEALLLPMGYEVVKASDGPAALEAVQQAGIDVVLLDVMMPGMSGYDVCRRLKNMEGTRTLPVILVTALEDVDSKVKGIQAGADEFLTKPVVREELLARTRSLVNLHRLSRNLVNIESALYSLANAVEAKDSYTLGHTQRVAALAVAVGGALGLREKDLSALRLGGILHDVGKIGVPEAVLNKGGPWTRRSGSSCAPTPSSAIPSVFRSWIPSDRPWT